MDDLFTLIFFKKKSLEKILLVSLDIKGMFEELTQASASWRGRAMFAFVYPVFVLG